jgi:23S rRNA pseudouridine1911/1915/1917 synthase
LEKRVVGDKIYGPDETLYINFVEAGWTDRLEAALPIKRQALHCYRYVFEFPEGPVAFSAPLQQDMLDFCKNKMGLSPQDLIGCT